MKQTKKRQPLAKMSLRYDKLIMGKDVFTYNEVTGMVELTGSGVGAEEGGRVSPTSQPTTPHHARAKSRSKSSGRRKRLEKAFSTGRYTTIYYHKNLGLLGPFSKSPKVPND